MTKRALSAVPVVAGMDLEFRPPHYWADIDPLSAIVQNIMGQNRRDMARAFIAGDAAKQFGEIEDGLLQDTIDDELRTTLSAIHPSYLGGEFLPDYDDREVEIARVVLESSTRDVMSLRATTNRSGTRMRYRMVDEYGGEYVVSPKSSRRPLSLRAVIALIDAITSDSVEMIESLFVENFSAWQVQNGESPYGATGFVSVESGVYPQLGAYYVARLDAWAAEEQRQLNLASVADIQNLEPVDDDYDGIADEEGADSIDVGGIIITGWQPPAAYRKNPEPPAAPGS